MGKVAIALGFAAAFGAVVVGCGGSGSNGLSPNYNLSIGRLKILNRGLLMYTNDWDDILPPGVHWMDSLGPYVTDSTNYRSPAVQAAGYGYALNAAIAGQSKNSFASWDTTVSLFDTTDLSRSAVSSTSTMPSPPRYGGHNTIAYLDGHVADEVGDTPAEQYALSQSRLRQSAVGIMLYSSDSDDHYPLANRWMDNLVLYHVSESSFRSPAAVKANASAYGYAFNTDLVGLTMAELESPAGTPMLFDSTVLTRNATANVSTMPSPGRYSGTNTIGYADSSVH